MIRVRKPDEPPEFLKKHGPGRTAEVAAAVAAAPPGDPPEVPAAVYNHKDVKAALRAAQHGKCCYCEAKVDANAYNDVEHFRPKGGWRQGRTDPLTRPGYHWLAYDWGNLFYACSRCNGEFKGNRFPLAAGGVRAAGPGDDLAAERPLLIDPAADDPERLIGWRADEAVPLRPGTPAGDRARTTIDVCGLNRPALRRDREELIEHLSAWKAKLNAAVENADRFRRENRPPTPEAERAFREVMDLVGKRIADAAPFAAMSRTYLNASANRSG